jgi:hypothetical protein
MIREWWCLQAIDARATHFFRVCVLVARVVSRPRVLFAPATLCSDGTCAIVQSLIAFVVLNVLLCSFRNINLCWDIPCGMNVLACTFCVEIQCSSLKCCHAGLKPLTFWWSGFITRTVSAFILCSIASAKQFCLNYLRLIEGKVFTYMRLLCVLSQGHTKWLEEE